VAQLHLAFPSPVAPVKRDDQGKLPGKLRDFNELTVVIGHFKIWKSLSNSLVHENTSFFDLLAETLRTRSPLLHPP
jgi:hypothetical protein